MLPPLHDRVEELQVVVEACGQGARGEPQLLIVSGHRRVGKTFLLSHVAERLTDQRVAFFSATQQAEAVELDRFARALQPAFVDEPLLGDGVALGSWERALEAVAAAARRLPVTVVIDEAPYLAEATPGFASVVQAVWDRVLARAEPTRLTLILTGSASRIMERMVGPGGPLRGRVTRHLRLKPFDLPAVARILDVEPSTAVEAYAACGGWPLHVAAWDVAASVNENLEHLAGQPGGILLEDADLILRELPEAPGFGRVLAAIGRGRTKRGDIATEAGQRVEYALDFLIESGLVRRETPLGAPRRSRPRYAIADPYLRFWFHLLHNDRARIEGGMGRAVLRSRAGEWSRHVGWVFEEAARNHAVRLVASGWVDDATSIGRWWSAGRSPAEVDVLGLLDGRVVLIGEAKWSAGPFDRRWVHDLDHKLDAVSYPANRPQRIIWTRAVPPGDLPSDLSVYGPADLVG